jgi:O-antigen/teichoic acid export membrane protein
MSIAANYLYNVLYQVIAILIPFITVPYISRVLGAEGVGINAYTGSIVQYFALFGTIGIGLYASRSIAYVRDDKEKLSKTFWSILKLQFTLCGTSLILYVLFIVLFIDNYKGIQFIQALNLVSAAIDINWLFSGIEDFKKLVVRSIILRILGVVCIFVFVRESTDLWKYISISSLSLLLGQVILWTYVGKIVDVYKAKYKDVIMHLKPSLALFVPQMAIQIYLVLNKTMLGVLANKQEVGFYENSDRVIKMSLAFLTATGTVMLPRVSNSFAKGETEKVKQYVYSTLNFVTYLSIPIMFGLIGIARQFVPWFFGLEFIKCILLISLLSPMIIAIAWSNVLGFQYMIPTGRTRDFTISVTVGAAVNFIINLLLIRKYHSVGAAAATIMAEITVTITQIFLLRKDLEFRLFFRNFKKYIFSGVVMFSVIFIFGNLLGPSTKTTFLQVVIGGTCYIVILFFLNSDINNHIIKLIYKKLYKKLFKKELGM